MVEQPLPDSEDRYSVPERASSDAIKPEDQPVDIHPDGGALHDIRLHHVHGKRRYPYGTLFQLHEHHLQLFCSDGLRFAELRPHWHVWSQELHQRSA